jgi:heme exporter protein B
MISIKEIGSLIRKEFLIEFREKYALGGILLYVATSVFIVMIAFGELEPEYWNLIFWILFLFASINAVLKSFVRESEQRYLYYYTLTHPVNLLFAKVLYNAFLLCLIGCLLMFALSIIAGNPIISFDIFFLAILMGSISLSLTFTFISSIAIKADNSATLLAILGFPLTIPIFINLIDLSGIALGLTLDENILDEVTILASIELLLCGAGMLLFPYLWRS